MTRRAERELPDYYACVAREVRTVCEPKDGVWVDLGCGAGPLAFALAQSTQSVFVLVDPDRDALSRALKEAEARGWAHRFVALVGRAESIPVADDSVDLVISRGSIFFWNDRPAGLRNVYRILRPGGKAMIRGGLGSTYPRWAREEFMRRRLQSVRSKGAKAMRAFKEVRKPETFRRWAREAGLKDFEVWGEGGLPEDDPGAGLGIWLRFDKEVP